MSTWKNHFRQTNYFGVQFLNEYFETLTIVASSNLSENLKYIFSLSLILEIMSKLILFERKKERCICEKQSDSLLRAKTGKCK